MYLREVKGYMRLVAICILNEFAGDFFIIEKGEFVFAKSGRLCDARMIVEIVIFTEVVLVQNLVNTFTTITAKNLVPQRDRKFVAGVATMFT